MNKKIIFTALLMASITGSANAWENRHRDEAIESLADQTAFRKGLKYWLEYASWSILPATGIGAYLMESDRKTGAGYGLAAGACFYAFIHLLRSGHKYFVQKAFRKLYNKRVDAYGNLVSDFHPQAHTLPFALDDRQFILFGFASGYTTDELIRLANKCGRTEVARQINHGEYFAHGMA